MLQAELIINALSDKKRFEQIDRSGDGVIQYVILEGEIGHQDALIRTQVWEQNTIRASEVPTMRSVKRPAIRLHGFITRAGTSIIMNTGLTSPVFI